MSEETKTYYERNREKQLAQAKQYRDKNKARYTAYWKTYYLANKTKLLEKRKQYARDNKEKIYEKNRTVYYPKHQQKKKDEPITLPAVLSPMEEVPRYTLVKTEGNIEVRFD